MAKPNLKPRRFTILDGMLLIIGLAAGLAWAIADMRSYTFRWSTPRRLVYWSISDLIPLVITPVTVVAFAIRFRPPAPPRRRLGREPGFVAIATATVVLVVSAPVSLVAPVAKTSDHFFDFTTYTNFWIPSAGPAVAGAWLLLIGGGRWRSEPTWFDRLGRGLGWLWILIWIGPFCLSTWGAAPVPVPILGPLPAGTPSPFDD